jgi:hypothetical protein
MDVSAANGVGSIWFPAQLTMHMIVDLWRIPGTAVLIVVADCSVWSASRFQRLLLSPCLADLLRCLNEVGVRAARNESKNGDGGNRTHTILR